MSLQGGEAWCVDAVVVGEQNSHNVLVLCEEAKSVIFLGNVAQKRIKSVLVRHSFSYLTEELRPFHWLDPGVLEHGRSIRLDGC